MNKALKATENDIVLTGRFYRVNNLVDSPTRLQEPALIAPWYSATFGAAGSTPVRRRGGVQPADQHVDGQLPKFRAEHLDAYGAVPAAVEKRCGETV